MKRLIVYLLALAMTLGLCACGGSSLSENGAVKDDGQSVGDILNIKSDNDPVDIYLSIMDFDNVGAEAYVANLIEENPEEQYRYYNEEYYIYTITEGERKQTLEKAIDVNAFFAEALGEEYPGMFISAELSKDKNKLTVQLNRDAYESNLFSGFMVTIAGGMYLDSIQAYSLITPEKRDAHLICIDENGEVLLDSDEFEDENIENQDKTFISKANYTLSNEIIVDNELCTFIVKDIDPDGDWGFTLNVFCENKTDTKLMFSWDDVSVMGYMVDPFWGLEVAAGKKANSSISFSYRDLDMIGMTSVDDIAFTLRVSDADDWMKDPMLVEQYSIYPSGKTIQEISYPSRNSNSNEMILYENNEYVAIILSDEIEDGDYLMYYYLENKTGHEIMFSMDDVSVNGYMADPFWGTSVAAGKKLYTTVCFYESILEDNGISNVEEVEFVLRVSNAESWSTHAKESFTYNP